MRKTRTCYLIDTGPLFDFLVIDHCKKIGTPWEGTAGLQHLQTEIQFAKFSSFVLANRPLFTVAGVIVELGGLFQTRRRKELHGDTGFWNSVWPHMTGANPMIDDRFVKAREVAVEVVREFGPVDASLWSLARRLVGENRPVKVITGDRKLRGAMQGEISMMDIHEIVSA